MELGLGLPTLGPLATPANIVRIATLADELGYAAVWAHERLLRPVAQVGAGPAAVPTVYRLTFDPIETLTYVAAMTHRVKLGTSVVDALLHPPVVLARRFATLDQFSGGRVIAGLGQGWMPQEFETANVPMSRRGAGLDEVVAAMRACWGPDPVEYAGRFYTIARSEINPKPVQEHLPILIGATTPAGIERTARIADGLNPIASSAQSLRETAASFRAAVTAAGRDEATVRVVARANIRLTVEDLGAGRPFLGGSPDQIAADLAELDGAGVDHVLLASIPSRGDADIDREVRLLTELRRKATVISWA